MKIIGEKRFSHDLNPGGMEHPAMYIYRYTNMDMHSKLLCWRGNGAIQQSKQ